MKILFYITGMILVFQKNEFCDERFFEKWNEKYELKNILVFADVYRIIEICEEMELLYVSV